MCEKQVARENYTMMKYNSHSSPDIITSIFLRTSWATCVVHAKELGNCKILVASFYWKKNNHLWDLLIDGMVRNRFWKPRGVGMLIGVIWHRIGTMGKVLWSWWCIFRTFLERALGVTPRYVVALLFDEQSFMSWWKVLWLWYSYFSMPFNKRRRNVTGLMLWIWFRYYDSCINSGGGVLIVILVVFSCPL
jgi:hypothetical protein